MLFWANRYSIFCFLDNQDYSVKPHHYECLLGVGVKESVEPGNLEDIDEFISGKPGWIFGHLAYDLKNRIHHMKPGIPNRIGFPDFYFFKPEFFLQLQGSDVTITAEDPHAVFAEIQDLQQEPVSATPLHLQQRLSRQAYIDTIGKLRDHIIRGDCYEINFCQEFFAEDAFINPVEVYLDLTHRSPNPFSALYRLNDHYLICASPERFLMKRGDFILSQPMKGTIRRDPGDAASDSILKKNLEESAKDRSENVMVVDMVRNDLTRICKEATVKVDELFGVYTYPHVHQMISTISGKLQTGITFSKIIEATFPMGSMTGAPKQRVMELIDQYETTTRGIFSGSVGYINPSGDFDFNVVIRSIMYNAAQKYLSYQVGSGITFYSDPGQEWAECLLKGAAMKQVLENIHPVIPT